MIPRLFVISAALAAAALLVAPPLSPAASAVPDGMAKIPGGTFEYGTDSADVAAIAERFHVPREIIATETPQYKVKVPTFYMDKTEVMIVDFVNFLRGDTTYMPKGDSGQISNGDYLKPWASGSTIPGTDSMPVTYVTWFAARAFCKHAGKRLPTEVEWEYAAHGGVAGDVFPWGAAPPDTLFANYGANGIEHPLRVGKFPPNPYGLYDMAGNVWEFTADQWTEPREMPTGKPVELEPWRSIRDQAARQRVVIRGGSYDGAPVNLRVRYRDSHPAGGAQPFVGFRCARNG